MPAQRLPPQQFLGWESCHPERLLRLVVQLGPQQPEREGHHDSQNNITHLMCSSSDSYISS